MGEMAFPYFRILRKTASVPAAILVKPVLRKIASP
jgi:hypothetical protein